MATTRPSGRIATSAAWASPIEALATALTARRCKSASSVVGTRTSPKSASNAFCAAGATQSAK